MGNKEEVKENEESKQTEMEEALELCDEILGAIEHELPEKAWDIALDFFEGIREKVKDLRIWVETNERATKKQLTALENWNLGVQAWIK